MSEVHPPASSVMEGHCVCIRSSVSFGGVVADNLHWDRSFHLFSYHHSQFIHYIPLRDSHCLNYIKRGYPPPMFSLTPYNHFLLENSLQLRVFILFVHLIFLLSMLH